MIDRDGKSIDQQNKDAPHINPEKSGIRSGNPQLDPESPRKEDEEGTGERREAPHAPAVGTGAKRPSSRQH